MGKTHQEWLTSLKIFASSINCEAEADLRIASLCYTRILFSENRKVGWLTLMRKQEHQCSPQKEKLLLILLD